MQLVRLLQLLQLMAAVHGAARGAAAKLWGDDGGAQLRALSVALRQQEHVRLQSADSRSPTESPAPSRHDGSRAGSEPAGHTAGNLQPDVQVIQPSQTAQQRNSDPAVEANAVSPSSRMATSSAAAALLGSEDAASHSLSVTDAVDEVNLALEGLDDDPWTEIHDKIQRQGGVADGGASRARQLRQECLVLLKDMVTPARGKVD